MKNRRVKITIRGKVCGGKGEGSFFVSKPWVMKQVKKKLGFKPYLGTLNIQLLSEYKEIVKILENHNGIEIIPKEGFCPGKCFKAAVSGRIKGAVVIPRVPSYPKDMLEIIAPVNLRETLGLKDGDEIEITVLL